MLDKAGNIKWVSDLIFKDSGEPDPKESRPCLLFLLNKNGFAYYLTMWTNNSNVMRTYLLCSESNVLVSFQKADETKICLVNLRNIYKSRPMPGNYYTSLPGSALGEIKKRFKEWQNDHPDEYYEEMKDLL